MLRDVHRASIFSAVGKQNKTKKHHMIKIHAYTATWDAAMNPKPKIRAGALVRIHQNSDAREFDSFSRHLSAIGMNDDEFVRAVGKYNVSKINHGKSQGKS